MRFLTEQEQGAVRKFLKKTRESLGDNLILAKIFGSKARGDSSEGSDIDLLLVVRRKTPGTRDAVFTALFEVDPYYEFRISPLIYSELEYEKNQELESPFVENVAKEGTSL